MIAKLSFQNNLGMGKIFFFIEFENLQEFITETDYEWIGWNW